MSVKLTTALLERLAEEALGSIAPSDFTATEAEQEADAAFEAEAEGADDADADDADEWADEDADEVAPAGRRPAGSPIEGVFVVEVTVSDSAIRPKARIVLDGDAGVDIAACAAVSRRVNRRLEEELGEEASYVLEVTSPGADQPLTLPRQFPRHLGRTLTITKTDGTTLTGVLREATAEYLALAGAPPKRGKYKQTAAEVAAAQPPAHTVPFADIRQAVIVISFK